MLRKKGSRDSTSGANFFVEPGTGECPIAFGRRLGNAQDLGSFSEGEPDKIAQLDQFGALGVDLGEFFERVTDGEDVAGFGAGRGRVVVQLDALLATAVADADLATRIVGKDPSHR